MHRSIDIFGNFTVRNLVYYPEISRCWPRNGPYRSSDFKPRCSEPGRVSFTSFAEICHLRWDVGQHFQATSGKRNEKGKRRMLRFHGELYYLPVKTRRWNSAILDVEDDTGVGKVCYFPLNVGGYLEFPALCKRSPCGLPALGQ